jgi:hypothetical protein
MALYNRQRYSVALRLVMYNCVSAIKERQWVVVKAEGADA